MLDLMLHGCAMVISSFSSSAADVAKSKFNSFHAIRNGCNSFLLIHDFGCLLIGAQWRRFGLRLVRNGQAMANPSLSPHESDINTCTGAVSMLNWALLDTMAIPFLRPRCCHFTRDFTTPFM
jgi:hypothetical protein